MGHTTKTFTEAELRDEIAKMLDGARSTFAAEPIKKKPGRPKGSKNKPKDKKK